MTSLCLTWYQQVIKVLFQNVCNLVFFKKIIFTRKYSLSKVSRERHLSHPEVSGEKYLSPAFTLETNQESLPPMPLIYLQ